MDATGLGFPEWVRLTHFFNILFLSLLVRSGIEILGGHPMLYWNDHSAPGSEWVRFTTKRMPSGELWTAEDEKQPYSPLVALPGRDHLGLGRYWHFAALGGWVLTGVLYVVLLFLGPQWQRLVPTSLDILPKAVDAGLAYFQLQSPLPGAPYNALQQLAYFGVIFILSPLQIATGLAMSPAVAGRFPWYTRLFGGRQAARSIHFLGLVAFLVFTGAPHRARGGRRARTGPRPDHPRRHRRPHADPVAVAVSIGIVGAGCGHRDPHLGHPRLPGRPRRMQRRLQRLVDPPQRRLLQGLRSRQAYPPGAITRIPRPNGRPPHDPDWQALAAEGFRSFVFEVSGMIERPLRLTLDDLRAMPVASQTTKHVCIQGWSQVVSWRGVSLATLLERARPTDEARYLLFRTFDDKWEHPGEHEYFYGVIDLDLARHPQSILAYEMNGQSLPIPFGAPLRLRLESQLGYKMVKWVRSVELVADYHSIGEGQGGWREDTLYYSQIAPI